jgi:serine/threonine protein kinase
LHYRSPEVIIGLPYNPSADIWSLGCVLYELIVGDCLFTPKVDNYEGEQELISQISEVFGEKCFAWAMKGKFSRKFLDYEGNSRKSPENVKNLEEVFIAKGLSEVDARETKEFLFTMIAPDPSQRMSASQCLNSRWIRGAK